MHNQLNQKQCYFCAKQQQKPKIIKIPFLKQLFLNAPQLNSAILL